MNHESRRDDLSVAVAVTSHQSPVTSHLSVTIIIFTRIAAFIKEKTLFCEYLLNLKT